MKQKPGVFARCLARLIEKNNAMYKMWLDERFSRPREPWDGQEDDRPKNFGPEVP